MVNYKLGKIYKIMSNQTNQIYVGSTTKKHLSDRMYYHRAKFRNWLDKKGCYYSSFELFEFPDVKIILIESYPCDNRDQLRMREQFHIDKNRDICVNIRNAFTDEKEYNRKYRKEHPEKFIKTEAQKEVQKKHQKKYRKHKVDCFHCNIRTSKADYPRHKRTEKTSKK